MDFLDLEGGKVLVEYLFQRIRVGRGVVSHESQPFAHLPPHQLLIRDLVIATILHDVVEQLVQVDTQVSHLGLGVKMGPALLMEVAKLLEELFIFGGSVDGMLNDGFGRGHLGASRRSSASRCCRVCWGIDSDRVLVL